MLTPLSLARVLTQSFLLLDRSSRRPREIFLRLILGGLLLLPASGAWFYLRAYAHFVEVVR